MSHMYKYSTSASAETEHPRPIIPLSVALSLDAILVLGGGVPLSPREPPEYVKARCDAAATISSLVSDKGSSAPAILCLSAGTAHLPQLIGNDGLPVWESTASAAYLIEHHGIHQAQIFVETTSYDTISNAFFARATFAEVVGWKKLLIVTSELPAHRAFLVHPNENTFHFSSATSVQFHMERTKVIFDWVFGTKNVRGDQSINYDLYYLACDNVGLSKEAVRIRKEHEARGTGNVRENLSKRFTTLEGVWQFLHSGHDLYTAKNLVNKARKTLRPNALLKDSYGFRTTEISTTVETYRSQFAWVFFGYSGALIAAALTISLIVANRRRLRKSRTA